MVYADVDDQSVIKMYRCGDLYIRGIIRELACMTLMRHKAILPAYSEDSTIVDDDFFVRIKSLIEIEYLTPDTLSTFLSPIASGLAYCHSIGIIHRDIKTDNVMFNPDTGWYVLIDWGLSSIMTSKHNFSTDTTVAQLKPPEWLNKPRFNNSATITTTNSCRKDNMSSDTINDDMDIDIAFDNMMDSDIKIDHKGKSDIWALAITAIMFICPLSNLFLLKNEKDILTYFENRFGRDREVRRKNLMNRTNHSLDDVILDILVDMLDFNPDTRISADEIMKRLKVNPSDDKYLDLFADSITSTTKTDKMFSFMEDWINIAAKDLQIIPTCLFTSLTLAMKVSKRIDITNKTLELICSACINISAHLYYNNSSTLRLCHYSGQFTEDDLKKCRNIVLEKVGFRILP